MQPQISRVSMPSITSDRRVLGMRHHILEYGGAISELEKYTYRVHHDQEGVSYFQGDPNNILKLPNPLLFWRYYSNCDMTVLPVIVHLCL